MTLLILSSKKLCNNDNSKKVDQTLLKISRNIYFTATRPNFSYVVGVVSQFMQNLNSHWEAILKSPRYLKGV